MNLKMVITDLDGTLLNPDREVSQDDLAALHQLGHREICRVIATGRSVYSFSKVIPDEFPIDFLIFSSGAGVMDWQTKEIINSNRLTAEETLTIIEHLKNNQFDFMVHRIIPGNHKFFYHQSGIDNKDFLHRIEVYKQHAEQIEHRDLDDPSSQFVVIFPPDTKKFEHLVEDLSSFKIIRTTSPFDHKSTWIEIFPENVSKGRTAEWLADRLGIPRNSVLSIGNDYNDIDLLDWSGQSYVVANAPDELKQKYQVTQPNHLSAFSTVVKQFLQHTH